TRGITLPNSYRLVYITHSGRLSIDGVQLCYDEPGEWIPGAGSVVVLGGHVGDLSEPSEVDGRVGVFPLEAGRGTVLVPTGAGGAARPVPCGEIQGRLRAAESARSEQ